MIESLKYLSETRLAQLLQDVSENCERYRSGDFIDFSQENGWGIESSLVKVDSSAFADLDGTIQTAEADARNSLIVYDALQGMTPALAVEECVWARLTHIECLEYTRARWFSKGSSYDDEKFDSQVLVHFFARGLTGIRDDNAISRLWWNMHIATMISQAWDEDDPDYISPRDVLGYLLKVADIRMHLVERSWTGSRLPLSKAIVKMIKNEPWLTVRGKNFNEFMKALNRDGGGVLLEALPDGECDKAAEKIMKHCLQKAKMQSQFSEAKS
jgi:hypothetical protein